MAQVNWITPAGSLGQYPANIVLNPVIKLIATSDEEIPDVFYTHLSGNLPYGLVFDNGTISGKPNPVITNTKYDFVIRATNTNGQISDRTFSITISSYMGPKFLLPQGNILTTPDSVWIEKNITYSNPYNDNPIKISVTRGILPPGLEINNEGILRGYADIPTITRTLSLSTTTAVLTSADTNVITCITTIDFVPYRPIIFTGAVFGGVIAGKTYYVKEILTSTTFRISEFQFGPELNITSGNGFMTVTLPSTSVGEPTQRTYSFDLLLESMLGNDIQTYSITVINQNLLQSKGGPGFPFLTRLPVILNTRPLTFNLDDTDEYFGYYLLPESGLTYPVNSNCSVGNFESNNYLSFKIIGHTFDDYVIKYDFSDLPNGLVGDKDTGWITGTPIFNSSNISQYFFKVRVYKKDNPALTSELYSFSLIIYKNITTNINWLSNKNLGTIFNSSLSNFYVRAIGDVELNYRLSAGTLPPNLRLLSNGEITGYTSHQPLADTILKPNSETVFDFTIEAYSPVHPVIKSYKNFSINVLQKYDRPFDTVYFKATPSIEDRELLRSLLSNTDLIPNNYLYRIEDDNYGKAKDVIYVQQYGVYSNDIESYLASVYHSYYLRNITLGKLKTAIARDNNGEIIYEVVYSEIIDDLVNPNGKSINFEILWPKPVSLNLGPWTTSVTDINSNYIDINSQNFYTSLTPGKAEVFYPNSLYNMDKQLAGTLGQEYDSRILPLWMTSQQLNGSTTGFVRAWVICYTKPGFAEIVKNNIETKWINAYGETNKLNLINFTLDRLCVSKYLTYNYNNYFSPAEWTGLPSASPSPEPDNSKDFYVLFPRTTILPTEPQL